MASRQYHHHHHHQHQNPHYHAPPVTPRQAPPPPPQQGVPPPPAPSSRFGASSSGMMNFVESFMSPFTQCWQPPIDACGSIQGECSDVTVCGPPPPRRPPPVNTAPPPTNTTTTVNRPPPNLVTPMGGGGTYHPYPHQHHTSSHHHNQQRLHGLDPNAPRVLTRIEIPTERDVLCGRGGSSNKHNLHFRELIAANKATYTTLTKKQKMLVSRQVVDTIHKAGGRFLAKDPFTGLFNDIGLPRSLEKASQALREKSTNLTDAVVLVPSTSEDSACGGGIETMSTHSSTSCSSATTRPNPKTIEAPPLVIPAHLQEVYKPRLAAPSDGAASAPPPPYGYSQPYHPSDRVQSMPAPHRGALPFSSRQMSRLTRQSRSYNGEARGLAAPVVSPVAPPPPPPHGMPWQQTPPAFHHTHHHRRVASGSPIPPPTTMNSWDSYPSDVASFRTDSTVTHSSPEFHQYYHHPVQHPHSPPQQDTWQEIKRQRTNEEQREHAVPFADDDDEEEDEEDVILFDNNDNTSKLNTSLTEGSEELPTDVESKLSLQERVISPSGMMQGTRRSRHAAARSQAAPDSPTIPTTGTAASSEKLNTSAEAAGGLVALSTAAFLHMDDGE